jgi:hypothetical protein
VPTKNRQQLLVILAVTAIGLFAGDRLVLNPLMNTWTARSKRIAKLKEQLEDGRRLLTRDRILRSRWDEWQRRTLTNDLSAAEQQIFNTIDRWAQETGVAITAITPLANQSRRDQEAYATYDCRIDATGDLSRLSRFLYSAEREPMALKLQSVELGARDKEGQQLSMGLQISGLILNSSAK